MSRSVDVLVSGRVQGVGFRYHAEREARRLGVVGWVRNEPDGSVAVHAEGTPQAVHDLLAWLRQGPPSADVERVDVTDTPATGAASFDVRF
jgi:acylphosphatase